MLIKNTGEEGAELRNVICKHIHMKNNAIISNKQCRNENCHEMSIQEVAKDCASFGVLIEAIYRIFALIIILNMIHM